jgi:hypothetical protein
VSALLDRPSPRPPTRRRSRVGALVAVAVLGTLAIGIAIIGALEQQQANTCGTPTTSASAAPPTTATPGQTLTGAVSWFGGPDDHTTGPTTADGKPVSDPGIAVYNTATLNGYWQVTFPNGRTAILQQTDIGPAPWTGRALDVLYSALPYIGYTEQDFPTGAQITAHYLGTSSKLASVAIGGGGTASAATADDCADTTSTGDRSLSAITAAANLLASMHVPYSYGGGHTLSPTKPTLGLDGTPPVGLDCSSSVSFVLQHAGFNIPTMTSTQLMTWGDPGPGQEVTIYTNTWHTFLKIGNRYFGTSGFGHPAAGGGPAWFVVDPSPSYLALFVARHPPGL